MSAAGRDGIETDWVCAECGVELTPTKIQLSYIGSVFSMPAHACPSCGLVLITEEIALTKLAEAEQILEDK